MSTPQTSQSIASSGISVSSTLPGVCPLAILLIRLCWRDRSVNTVQAYTISMYIFCWQQQASRRTYNAGVTSWSRDFTGKMKSEGLLGIFAIVKSQSHFKDCFVWLVNIECDLFSLNSTSQRVGSFLESYEFSRLQYLMQKFVTREVSSRELF